MIRLCKADYVNVSLLKLEELPCLKKTHQIYRASSGRSPRTCMPKKVFGYFNQQ